MQEEVTFEGGAAVYSPYMDQLEKDIEEAEAELEALVQEGLDSGSGEEMMRGDFESIRREMHAQHSSKGK